MRGELRHLAKKIIFVVFLTRLFKLDEIFCDLMKTIKTLIYIANHEKGDYEEIC